MYISTLRWRLSDTPRLLRSLDLSGIALERSCISIELTWKNPWYIYCYSFLFYSEKWYLWDKFICSLKRTRTCLSVCKFIFKPWLCIREFRLRTIERAISSTLWWCIFSHLFLRLAQFRIISLSHLCFEIIESWRYTLSIELIKYIWESSIEYTILRKIPRENYHEIWKSEKFIRDLIRLTSDPIHDKLWKSCNTRIFYTDYISCRKWFRSVYTYIYLCPTRTAISYTDRWSSEVERSSSSYRESLVHSLESWISGATKIWYDISHKWSVDGRTSALSLECTARTIPCISTCPETRDTYYTSICRRTISFTERKCCSSDYTVPCREKWIEGIGSCNYRCSSETHSSTYAKCKCRRHIYSNSIRRCPCTEGSSCWRCSTNRTRNKSKRGNWKYSWNTTRRESTIRLNTGKSWKKRNTDAWCHTKHIQWYPKKRWWRSWCKWSIVYRWTETTSSAKSTGKTISDTLDHIFYVLFCLRWKTKRKYTMRWIYLRDENRIFRRNTRIRHVLIHIL